MRILLLEDDPGLGRGVSAYLRLLGHEAIWAETVAAAEQQLAEGKPVSGVSPLKTKRRG